MRKEKKKPEAPSHRTLRVGEEMKHILATIFMREEVTIAGVNTMKITVTEVRAMPDLKTAIVYIMTLNGERVDEVIELLEENNYLVRMALAKQLTLKFTPSLKFEKDITFDEASKINQLLKQSMVSSPN
jgi:ribosome-binding factor A